VVKFDHFKKNLIKHLEIKIKGRNFVEE